MKSISVLIPNRFSWNGICLTIESVLKRTEYLDGHEIIVCDNSQAPNNRACEPHEVKPLDGDNGCRIDYLRDMARQGKIRLIENLEQDKKYGHGENIKLLLGACNSNYALLFVSAAEITSRFWLSQLVNQFTDESILGVARYRPPVQDEYSIYRAPLYWPNIMMLDMTKYTEFAKEGDFDLCQMRAREFPFPRLFGQISIDPNGLIFADTGWRFFARIHFDNPKFYRIAPLPNGYYNTVMRLYGGIDRNSHRPQIPYVKSQLDEIDQRLAQLRKE